MALAHTARGFGNIILVSHRCANSSFHRSASAGNSRGAPPSNASGLPRLHRDAHRLHKHRELSCKRSPERKNTRPTLIPGVLFNSAATRQSPAPSFLPHPPSSRRGSSSLPRSAKTIGPNVIVGPLGTRQELGLFNGYPEQCITNNISWTV